MPKRNNHSKQPLGTLTKLSMGHGGQVLPSINTMKSFGSTLASFFGKGNKYLLTVAKHDVENINNEFDTAVTNATNEAKEATTKLRNKQNKDILAVKNDTKGQEKHISTFFKQNKEWKANQTEFNKLENKKKLNKKQTTRKEKLNKMLTVQKESLTQEFIKEGTDKIKKSNTKAFGKITSNKKSSIDAAQANKTQKLANLQSNLETQTEVNKQAAGQLLGKTAIRTVRGVLGALKKY